MEYIFETMNEVHRKSVIDIFNYFVENSFAAYPDSKFSYEAFGRFMNMSDGWPRVVVKTGKTKSSALVFSIHTFHTPHSNIRWRSPTLSFQSIHTRDWAGECLITSFPKRRKWVSIPFWPVFLLAMSKALPFIASWASKSVADSGMLVKSLGRVLMWSGCKLNYPREDLETAYRFY